MGPSSTPSGLSQSWSCSGGNNVAHYCDPVVDSLIDRAILEADEREASDRQRSEEAGSKAISRLPGRAVLVDGAADLTQTERAGFCA